MVLYVYSKNDKYVNINYDLLYILKDLYLHLDQEQIMQKAINMTEEDIQAIREGVLRGLRSITNTILMPTDYLVMRSIEQQTTLQELNPEIYEFRQNVKQLYQNAKETILNSSNIEEWNTEELLSLIKLYVK